MKSHYLKALSFVTLLTGSAFLHAADLHVDIESSPGNDGKLYVALFNSITSMTSLQAYDGKIEAPTGTTTRVIFKGIPEGEYAVMVYQDSDHNGQLNRDNQGLPTEPVGSSNNPQLMGPPTFDLLKFDVKENQENLTSIRVSTIF